MVATKSLKLINEIFNFNFPSNGKLNALFNEQKKKY